MSEINNKQLKRDAREALRKERRGLSAVGKFLRCPPRKAQMRAKGLVGAPVLATVEALKCAPGSSARLLRTVIFSAISNAARVLERKVEELDDFVIDKILVGDGPRLKRFHPVSHGTAKPILKRMCRVEVWVKRK
ncbi:MAG: uL22 family ribosomal protein [Deltaproteobacteria bacterium]|jgi:large subunit ribosomal protein L22|nr:uL22 family ribosomal protein [Deltaproteobacteria bacterium]